MRNSFLANAILVLSLFYTLTLAGPAQTGAKLVVRQQTAVTDPCLDYSRTANLSTIGSNTTYRSAYYARSTTGTMYDGRMFSQAILALPALTADVALNSRCKNLTEVALVEAERNFTLNIVGPFEDIVVEGIKAGPEVCVIVTGIVLLFFVVWSFMP